MASGSKKVVYAALIGNSLIAVTKFIAAAFTGSSAMVSEGIHSVVDTGNQVLLLHGMRRAARPPDEKFPFGYGKEIYFWSFVVAILIFAGGAGLSFYEGVHHLLHPTPIENPEINYVVLLLAVVFEGVAWLFAWKEFSRRRGELGTFEEVHRSKDPTVFVVLFEDSAAMLGLLAAFVGVLLADITGVPHFDAAASIAIGVILAGTAIWLAYETKGLLIGESARREVVASIREMTRAHARVCEVNEVLTVHMGPEFILVNLSVEFEDEATASEVEEIVAGLDRRIKETFPRVKKVFVEAEPVGRRAGGDTDRGDGC
jgi:cation diffusion facilitator family transporter